MKRCDAKDMFLARRLFEGWEETLIYTALEGEMGCHIDISDSGKCARATVHDFRFFAGDAADPEAVKMLTDLPSDRHFFLYVGRTAEWEALIERELPAAYKLTRYAIKKEKDVFDRDKLTEYINALPEGFTLRDIDDELYGKILEAGLNHEALTNFGDAAGFRAHGLGCAVLHGGEVVSCASSYSWYSGGVEIDIVTREDMRHRGLALACAAGIMLRCLDRNLYPSWDASNPGSVKLAEKLGYHFDHEYRAYSVRW